MLSFLYEPSPSGGEGSRKSFPSLGKQQVVFIEIDIHLYTHFSFLLEISVSTTIYILV